MSPDNTVVEQSTHNSAIEGSTPPPHPPQGPGERKSLRNHAICLCI